MESSHSPLQDQLDQGETLVWVGKANSDRLLRKSDYAWVWLGVLLGTIAMAAFVGAVVALIDGSGVGAVLGLLVAIIVGFVALYFVFGRFASRFRKTRRAAYGITSSRAIVMQSSGDFGAPPAIEQVALSPDLTTHLDTFYEGRGTITIGDLTFENIDDAPVVYELLQAQIAQSGQPQG